MGIDAPQNGVVMVEWDTNAAITLGNGATEHAEANTWLGAPDLDVIFERDTDHFPLANALATQPRSTCHLCKGPANVKVGIEDEEMISAGITFFMHMHMFNQTYQHSVQVCHQCFEELPGPMRYSDVYASLQLQADEIETLYPAIMLSSKLPDTVARKITDYVFAQVVFPQYM